MDMYADVKQFMQAMGQECPKVPTVPDATTRQLRANLNFEEAIEFAQAIGFDVTKFALYSEENPDIDLVAAADAIADLIYVALGAAIALGVDIRPVWDIVQRCNMAKLGGPVRADGKRLKPEGWVGPEAAIAAEIERQKRVLALVDLQEKLLSEL